MRKDLILDIDEQRLPYNTRLVLPLPQLQQVMHLIGEEMMLGLVDTDRDDRVVLQMKLDGTKLQDVRNCLMPVGTNLYPAA